MELVGAGAERGASVSCERWWAVESQLASAGEGLDVNGGETWGSTIVGGGAGLLGCWRFVSQGGERRGRGNAESQGSFVDQGGRSGVHVTCEAECAEASSECWLTSVPEKQSKEPNITNIEDDGGSQGVGDLNWVGRDVGAHSRSPQNPIRRVRRCGSSGTQALGLNSV